MKGNYQEIETRMEKTIGVLKNEFSAIRAGRANPGVLNKITVDYYGAATPVPQIGTVSVPDPRTLMIQPWDVSVLKELEKALLASDIGITPTNDGKVIRLTFPPLTEERRKEIVKGLYKTGEESKVAIRSIRRDALEGFKKQQKNSEITEDDLKDIEKDVQSLTDDAIKEIDKVVKAKEVEILEI